MGCLPQRRTWLRWRCCWLRWGRPNKGRCGRGSRVGVMAALAELSGFCVESCGAGACFGRVSGGGLELVSCLGSQTPSSSNSPEAAGHKLWRQHRLDTIRFQHRKTPTVGPAVPEAAASPWGNPRAVTLQAPTKPSDLGRYPTSEPTGYLHPVTPCAVCRAPMVRKRKVQKTQAETLTGPPPPPPWAPPPQTLPRPHPPRGPAAQRQSRTRP